MCACEYVTVNIVKRWTCVIDCQEEIWHASTAFEKVRNCCCQRIFISRNPHQQINIVRWHFIVRTLHTKQVISRAFHAASRVASVLTTAGPSPRICSPVSAGCRHSHNHIPCYGFPLWNPPNAKLWNKLESAVCLPLRCALALPSNTQRLAVMADFGIVGPRAQHQRAALSFAHRAATLPSEHTTRVLFDKQRQQPIRAVRKSYMPFANKVRKTEALWNINHADANAASSRSLTRAALEAQLQQLRNPFPKTRFSWLHLEPQPTPYILRDDRQTAQLRARIRLNRHHFNTRLLNWQTQTSAWSVEFLSPTITSSTIVPALRSLVTGAVRSLIMLLSLSLLTLLLVTSLTSLQIL